MLLLRIKLFRVSQGALILVLAALLCFTDIVCVCVFFFSPTNWRFVPTLWSSQYVGTIFPRAFGHLMSLCHILVILTIFQAFSLLLYFYDDLWLVISAVTIVTVWAPNQLCPFKLVNVINKCMCSDCSTGWPFPCLSLCLGLLIPWDTEILKLGQLIKTYNGL